MSLQGQSEVTFDKLRRIGSGYAMDMRITNNKFRGYRFFSFDANCGSGHNEDVGVPGSPLVFWRAANEYLTDMVAEPFFCDHDEAALKALEKRLAAIPAALERSRLLLGDNDDALEVFAEHVRSCENPKYAVGCVLVDPNGYYWKNKQGTGAPTKALEWFVREFPRIDLFLNLNIRTYRLMNSQPWSEGLLAPDDLLRSLGKDHWHVAEANFGNSRFILAIGRNIAVGDHAAVGLHRWDGPIGHKILADVKSNPQGKFNLE